MFNHLFISLFFSLILSFSASANNPFAKSESLTIGKDVSWQLDKKAGVATKSKVDKQGSYYHLQFNNKQLELFISLDAEGLSRKKYDQLDIKDVKIDGVRSVLFQWCLDNQESQDRFLQQGLNVKNNVCVSNGRQGSFVIQLDGSTLASLKSGRELVIVLKPFRTPLELHFDITDFKNMVSDLNAKPAPAIARIAPASTLSTGALLAEKKKVCFSGPPAKYKSISAIKYACADGAAKRTADKKIDKLVKQQKDIEVKERKLAEEKRRQEQAAAQAVKLEQEKMVQAEAAAVAASEAKQAEIGGAITLKMVSMCEKYWDKGEHRCYCQKYIEYAPSEIQENSSCK